MEPHNDENDFSWLQPKKDILFLNYLSRRTTIQMQRITQSSMATTKAKTLFGQLLPPKGRRHILLWLSRTPLGTCLVLIGTYSFIFPCFILDSDTPQETSMASKGMPCTQRGASKAGRNNPSQRMQKRRAVLWIQGFNWLLPWAENNFPIPGSSRANYGHPTLYQVSYTKKSRTVRSLLVIHYMLWVLIDFFRVLNIPMVANADYRCRDMHFWLRRIIVWQPTSSTGQPVWLGYCRPNGSTFATEL